jgi:hypothetical protein
MKFTRSDYIEVRADVAAARAVQAEPQPLNAAQVQRVKAIDEQAAEVLARMEAVRDRLRARIVADDPNVRIPREQRDASDRAKEDAKTITRGTWGNGYWHPDLREFADGPGIETLTRLRAECREVLETEAARQATVWPRQFEYCGPAGRAELDGQLLKVGDRVMLTESQANARADRFQRVDVSQVEVVTS